MQNTICNTFGIAKVLIFCKDFVLLFYYDKVMKM